MAIKKNTGLISLADAKRYLNISSSTTDRDRFIDSLVTQCSVMIQKEIGYNIPKQDYSEFYDGNGRKDLWLVNMPVDRIERACIGRLSAIAVTYSGTASRATAEVTGTGIRLRTVSSGVASVTTLLFTANVSITLIAAAISAVSGWTGTVQATYAEYPSGDLIKNPARSTFNSKTVYLEIPNETESEYEIYSNEGRVYNPYGWDNGRQNIFICYTAGYDSVPAPLQSACQEMVSIVYYASARDTSLLSETIGDYEYTIKGGDNLGAALSFLGEFRKLSSIQAKLLPYRRIILG